MADYTIPDIPTTATSLTGTTFFEVSQDGVSKKATPATVAAHVASVLGLPGHRYTLDMASQADSDPGAGKLRFDDTVLADAGFVYIDDATADAVDLSAYYTALGATGFLRIFSLLDPGEWIVYRWTAITDGTGYFKFAVTHMNGLGLFEDLDAALVLFDSDANTGSGGGGGDSVLRGDAMDSIPPTSNFATPDTLANGLPVLDFDGGSTNEAARWIRRLPTGFTGTLDFTIKNTMTSATSGNVRWGVRVMRLNADISVDAFDTAVEAHTAVSGDVDDPTTTTLSSVGVDGAAAGEEILIEIYRDASDTTNDTATGDAELWSWQAEQT